MSNEVANASPPAQQIIIRQTGGAGTRLLFWMGWIGFAICLISLIAYYQTYREYFNNTEGATEKFHSGDRFASDKVAVIRVSGVIVHGEGYVKKQIERIRKDDNVKAIVLRVDSPGGTITGSDYIYHHLKKLREEKQLPMVVSMGSVAASGGYYVSMAVGDQPDCIFAEPTTTTGSIGVIIPHYDISGLMKEYHVRDDSIASHPRKQMGAMTRPVSDEDRQLLQSYVDESFDIFKERVKAGRPKFRSDEQALNELATGEIYNARKAKELGLVDRIGFIEEAIDRVVELADLDPQEVRVIQYSRPPSLMDAIGFVKPPSHGRFDLSSMLDFSAPRVWCLCTTMRPLVKSRPQPLLGSTAFQLSDSRRRDRESHGSATQTLNSRDTTDARGLGNP